MKKALALGLDPSSMSSSSLVSWLLREAQRSSSGDEPNPSYPDPNTILFVATAYLTVTHHLLLASHRAQESRMLGELTPFDEDSTMSQEE